MNKEGKTDHLRNYQGVNTTGRTNTGLCAIGLLVWGLERKRKLSDTPSPSQFMPAGWKFHMVHALC